MNVTKVILLVSILSCVVQVSAKAKVYVANEEDGTISVIDSTSVTVSKTIDLMSRSRTKMTMFMAHNVQVSSDKKTVWVTAVTMGDDELRIQGEGHGGTGDDEVIVIDSQADRILKRIPLGKELHLAHVVVDEQNKNVYVTANKTDEIFQIDAVTYQVVNKFQLSKGSGPHGAGMCGDNLYVAKMGSNGLAVLNTKSGKVLEVALGGVAVQTACADENTVFVSLYDTKEIVKYDLTKGQLTRIKLPAESQGPAQLTITEDKKTLLVADQGILLNRPSSNIVYELSVSNLNIVAQYKVGDGAHGIAINKLGQLAYITSQNDSKVTGVDLVKKQVIGEVVVGKKPNGISILND